MLYGFGNQVVILLTSKSMTLKSREKKFSPLAKNVFYELFNTMSLSIPYVEVSFLISHFSSFFYIVYSKSKFDHGEKSTRQNILVKLPTGRYFSVGYLLCPGVGRVGSYFQCGTYFVQG